MEEDSAFTAWRALAETALKGTPPESLTTPLEPLTGAPGRLWPFHAPAHAVYAGRAVTGPWSVVQPIDRDGAEGAQQAREDLENGADALAVVFAGAPLSHGRGLTANTVDGLDAALEGVRLDLVPLHLHAGTAAPAALALLLSLCERRGTVPAALHAGIDPAGTAAARGRPPDFARIGEALALFDERGLAGTALLADGRIAAEAGARPADELAFVLSSLAATLAALDAQGMEAAHALPRIAVALAADHEEFVTIAKLRAMRRLHALLAHECGAAAPLALHVTTAAHMMAASDPHTNLVRLTVAAFAAAAGGADALTVLPFDRAASSFARRLSRNIQRLLIEESHVARLDDPGAGSGAIETLTETLAEAAWQTFRANAAAPAEWLHDGTLARRAAEGAARERVIIGVTKHPPAAPDTSAPPAPVAAPDGEPADGPLAALVTRASQGAGFDMRPPPQGANALVPRRAAAPYKG